MIKIPCYEPAGQILQFSPDELSRHILGLGATGSGKTTALINPLLTQVIAWNAGDQDRKPGLLVLDPKQDDTVDKVRLYAREAGRLDDVVTLSTHGDSYYGYFADFKKLEQVDEFTRRVLWGSREMGDQNAYWTEARFGLINSALTVLLARDEPMTFDRVAEFLRQWFFDPGAQGILETLQFVERLLSREALKPATRRRLQLAVMDAQNWKALDQRTRELLKSCLNNALRILLSPEACDIFAETKSQRFDPALVLSGKILVASINAVSYPGLTAMLFKALKRDYYQAVLSRLAINPDRDRLCGLILDELPLSVTPEDADALALLRSKGGFVVACSQGISGLDEMLGYQRRAALLANFNSVLYFSSREDQTDGHAMLALGFNDPPRVSTTANDLGDLQVLNQKPSIPQGLVCPPGSLARLAPHQAYAKIANGNVTRTPLWLAPRFHDFVPPPPLPEVNDLTSAAKSLKAYQEVGAERHSDVSLFMIHMHRQKHALMLTPNVLAAAWQLCRPRTHQNRILARLGGMIHGVENLPPCWIAGLYRWMQKSRTLAASVVGVSIEGGVLWPELDTAFSMWGEGYLSVPEAINCFVYPSLWRPLLPRHWKRLKVDRPDLREELQTLPQVAEETGSF